MLNFLKGSGKPHQSFVNSAEHLLLGNTTKAVNTVADTAQLAYDVGRQKVAGKTHNKKAAANADIAAANTAQHFKDTGGAYDAGTFYKDPKEASKPMSFKGAAKKSLGATIGIGTEILPFAKGAGIAAKGVEGAEDLTKTEQAAKGIKSAVKAGAGYGGAGAAGQDLANDKNLSFEDIVKGTLTGAGMGVAGYGAGKGVKVVAKGAKEVAAAPEKVAAKDSHLHALDDSYGRMQKQYDQTNSTQVKNALNKQMAANRVEYGQRKNSIKEGGYVSLGGDEPKPVTPVTPPTGVQRAMDIVAPAPKTQEAQKVVDAATTSASKLPTEPMTFTEALDAQLGKFDSKYQAPENIKGALKNSKAVGTPATKHDFTETFRDPTGVLGSHFGETGTTAAYKLQQGAKTVSDIEEAVRPDIQKATKQLNKIAKSDAGRADVQTRINSALEDRANADTYLKTPKEKELFTTVSKVFDFFKEQRAARGKAVVGENYSPRTQMKDALDAPDRMLNNVKQAFSPNVQSQFSKERINDLPEGDLNTRIVDLLPHYASSQAKEFGYDDAMKYIQDNLKKTNPAYIANEGSRRRGEKYLQTLLTQTLQPSIPTKFERLQNKAIGNTYKAQLGFSPKFAAQNITQRYATKTQVSRGATKLANKMDKQDLADLQKDITTGYNPILSEMDQSAESTGKVRGVTGKLSGLDPGQKVEKGNVSGAFNRGAAQTILESQVYKDALKAGNKPKAAAKIALQDKTTRDLAVRRGNIVVNTTQFGGNFAAKPEFLRESGSFLGLSKKWYQQYQRFPTGMMQIIGNVVKPDNARSLDILRRGDPRETPIVDYYKAAKGLQAGVDDLAKGAKKGEIDGVTSKDVKAYSNLLNEAVKTLEKQMKGASQIRGPKTAKNLAKMWAAASTIQFLFDGGSNSSTAQKDGTGAEVRKSVQFGAPVNVPTKNENPALGARIPSSPIDASGHVNTRKLLNFVPIVGPVVNRGSDIKRLMGALTGDN